MESEKGAEGLSLISRLVQEKKVILYPIYAVMTKRWLEGKPLELRPPETRYEVQQTPPASSPTSENPPQNLILISRYRKKRKALVVP